LVALAPFLLFVVVGCSGNGPGDDPGDPPAADVDGDGYSTEEGDCDDSNEAIHPAADEIWYDGVDQNCDGADDFDADGDGVQVDADCDDLDATSTVLAEDADCDGTLAADDCDDLEAKSTILAEDADCDGTRTAEDCDDGDPTSTVLAEDADCDGSPDDEDCDDLDPTIFPSAIDVPGDGIDNNCNGVTDGAIPSASSWAIVQGVSSSSYYNFGMSLCGAGDVDGDGLDDLWIGAPNNTSPYNGSVVMIPGSALAAGGLIASTDAAGYVLGGSTYDRAGQTLHCPGDLDGDGLPELMVGTDYAQAANAFKVYLVWGDQLPAQGSGQLAVSADILAGPEYGFSTDGLFGPELVLTGGTLPHMKTVAVADLPLTESVLSSGADWAELDVHSTQLVPGDMDGDGLSDLVVGSGAGVSIYLAASRPTDSSILTLGEWDIRVTSTQSGDGFAVTTGLVAADLDGDGRDDLLVSADDTGTDGSGAVYIFLADTLSNAAAAELTTDDADVVLDTSVPNAHAAGWLAIDSDLDGDGLADLVVVGRREPGTGGWARRTLRIFFGHSLLSSPSRDLLLPDAHWAPPSDSPGIYLQPVLAGDVNGDGRDDLAVSEFDGNIVYVLTDLIP